MGGAVSGAGPDPLYTYCKFKNNTSTDMIYKDSHVWKGGSIPSDFSVPAKQENYFHHAVRGIGSIGGIVLTQKDTLSDVNWIVAWSNKVNTFNQVYISVTRFNVNWDLIKAKLDRSKNHSESHSSKADIVLMTDAPSMKAELNDDHDDHDEGSPFDDSLFEMGVIACEEEKRKAKKRDSDSLLLWKVPTLSPYPC